MSSSDIEFLGETGPSMMEEENNEDRFGELINPGLI